MMRITATTLTEQEVEEVISEIENALRSENIILSDSVYDTMYHNLKTVKLIKVGNNFERFTDEVVKSVLEQYKPYEPIGIMNGQFLGEMR